MKSVVVPVLTVLLAGGVAVAQTPSWLGVSVADGQDGGVQIEGVEDGGPAAVAGLASGDVVLEFDGMRVVGVRQFRRLVRETPAGRTVSLRIQRGDEERTLEITTGSGSGLEDFTEAIPGAYRDLSALAGRVRDAMPDFSVSVSMSVRGVRVDPMTPQLREFFGVDPGIGVLVSSVETGSVGERSGLRAGDVIVRVDGRSVDSPGEFRRRVVRDETVTLSIARDGSDLELTLDPASTSRELPD